MSLNMNKLFHSILLFSLILLLVSCGETHDNVPDDKVVEPTQIILDNLPGEGTANNPYKVTLSIREEFTTAITMVPQNAVAQYSYGFMRKVNNSFESLPGDEVRGFSLNPVESKSIFSITGRVVGTHYVELRQNNIETLIEVTVTEQTYTPMTVDYSKQLKVLAIGNSYSDDAMQYLYQIADDYGIEDIILGNLVVAGAELSQHASFAVNNSKAYVYRKTTNGTWIDTPFSTLLQGLTDEDWDIITIQEAPVKSGLKDQYEPYLTRLINYVHGYKTNPNAKIFWHLTWANETGNDHAFFEPYNYDQQVMYDGIIEAYETVVSNHDRIEGLIPVGTVIQNLRSSYMGDTFTRDGYHLSYGKGRYIAGLTFFRAITDLNIDSITYLPTGFTGTDEVKLSDLDVIKESIEAAIIKPLEITPSTYTN